METHPGMDILIEATKRCNFRCRTCKAWNFSPEEEISIEQLDSFISSFSSFKDRKVSFTFGGGEPLLKKGIVGTIKLCARKGYDTTLTSNGYLIDEKTSREIVDSGLTTIVISLNSLNPLMHDYLKGKEGAHKKAMEAIDLISGMKNSLFPRIIIGALITGKNLGDIVSLTQWACADPRISGIRFQAITRPFFTDEGDAWYLRDEYKELWPQDKEMVTEVIDKVIALKRSSPRIENDEAHLKTIAGYFRDPDRFIKKGSCHIGYRNFSIGSSGNLYLCFLKPHIDTIIGKDFESFWNSETVQKARKEIRECKYNCQILVNCWFENEGG